VVGWGAFLAVEVNLEHFVGSRLSPYSDSIIVQKLIVMSKAYIYGLTSSAVL
jgi:hypothetical protein